MRKAVALSLLAAALLVGCGGDDGPPSATEWADDLCSALGDWTSSLTTAAESVTSEPSRESVESAVDDVEGATQQLVDDVEDLETPDLEAGQEAEESVDEPYDETAMNSIDTGVLRARARSAMNITAPLSTPTSRISRPA